MTVISLLTRRVTLRDSKIPCLWPLSALDLQWASRRLKGSTANIPEIKSMVRSSTMVTPSPTVVAASALPTFSMERCPTASLRQVRPMADSTSASMERKGLETADEGRSIQSSNPDCIVVWLRVLGSVSRKSRELFGPEKPFLKLRPPYSVKLFFFICCKGSKNKNNCKVSCLETPLFWRYKEYYVTRNAPERFRDFRETGPWTPYRRHVKLLDQFHQRCLRRILKFKSYNRVSNVNVLLQAKMPSIDALLTQSQLRWSGHLVRMQDNRLPKRLFYSELSEGHSSRGRPKLRYKDTLKKSLQKCDID